MFSKRKHAQEIIKVCFFAGRYEEGGDAGGSGAVGCGGGGLLGAATGPGGGKSAEAREGGAHHPRLQEHGPVHGPRLRQTRRQPPSAPQR